MHFWKTYKPPNIHISLFQKCIQIAQNEGINLLMMNKEQNHLQVQISKLQVPNFQNFKLLNVQVQELSEFSNSRTSKSLVHGLSKTFNILDPIFTKLIFAKLRPYFSHIISSNLLYLNI